MKIKLFLAIVFFMIINTCVQECHGSENIEYDNEEISIEDLQKELDYSEIQKIIDDNLGKNKIDFEEQIQKIIANEGINYTDIIKEIIKTLKEELINKKSILVKIVLLGIFSAVFTKFSSVFKNSYISETGFNISYLIMFALLIGSFNMAYSVSVKTIEILLTFMRVIVPVYTLAIGMSNGSITSMAFYEGTFILITIVEWLFLNILLPIINVFVMIVIANNISEEDMLSQFAALIKKIINWSTKALLSTTVMIQTIRRMMIMNNNTINKTVAYNVIDAVPVVGDTISSVGDTFSAATGILKNAVGLTGIIVLAVACIIPIVKLLVFVLTYYTAAAIVQPVSDNRVVKCVGGVGEGAQMLVEVTLSGLILFLITLALIAG